MKWKGNESSFCRGVINGLTVFVHGGKDSAKSSVVSLGVALQEKCPSARGRVAGLRSGGRYEGSAAKEFMVQVRSHKRDVAVDGEGSLHVMQFCHSERPAFVVVSRHPCEEE